MSIRHPAPDLEPLPMVHGIASSERIIDHSRALDGSDQQVWLAKGCDLTTPIPLKHEHGAVVGKVIYLKWIKTQLYMRAIVLDDAIWRQVERCQLRGLSAAFTPGLYDMKVRAREGVVKYHAQYTLREISVVKMPANGDCIFRVFSGAGAMAVANQRSLSEHRQIIDRAKRTVARVNATFKR